MEVTTADAKFLKCAVINVKSRRTYCMMASIQGQEAVTHHLLLATERVNPLAM